MTWVRKDEDFLRELKARQRFVEDEELDRFFLEDEEAGEIELYGVQPDRPRRFIYEEPATGFRIFLQPELSPEVDTPVEGFSWDAPLLDELVEQYRHYITDEAGLEAELEGRSLAPVGPTPPICVPIEDHLSNQRDQGRRRTCVAFASIALAEAGIDRQLGGLEEDLSEQDLHFKFYEEIGRSHALDRGFPARDAPSILQKTVLVQEDVWPYIREHNIVANDVEQERHQRPRPAPGPIPPEYKMRGFRLLGNQGSPETLAKNHRLLEVLISSGYPVVMEIGFGGVRKNGIFVPGTRKRGSHALLFGGYDASRQIFAAKDSANRSPVLFSYEMVAHHAVSGFTFERFTQI